MNILLIEPDKLLASQYTGFLSGKGHSVRHADNAQDAVLAADKQSPDLVIIEPLLASHSGIEFLYEFRSYGEWQAVPIIVLSRATADELGLNDKARQDMKLTVLYKPETTLDKLDSTILRIVS